ncbi:hypothetical protein [Sandarakinorhabdus limnophila]|uniref:hypothetical protein n=1 Tax=Sandarakinorhabdus limnophila TaxID=210512 RepID=UPI0012EB8BE6|nr:hypothetical protein [Sandarakinorhabdus limnophila]
MKLFEKPTPLVMDPVEPAWPNTKTDREPPVSMFGFIWKNRVLAEAGSARPIASAAIAAEARKFLVICSPNWNVHVVR